MSEEMENQTAHLTNQNLFGLPVDTANLFSNHKNIYKRRIEKRQRKLLKKISFILSFMHEGEKILQVTTGCSPASFIEQFLTGWIVFQLKRSLFIFTNKRIFHIPTKPNFSYRNSIAQILYPDCQRIFMQRSILVAEYKNGQKEKFLYIAGRERKKIKTLLKDMPVQGQQSATPERTHLCPRCMNPLIKDNFTCPSCSLEFKNKAQAKRISIIYPGGGYFYTHHSFLGLADALVELYLSILVLAALVSVITGFVEAIPALVFFSIILAVEKILTVYHSNHFIKEYIPKDRRIEMLVGAQESPQQIAPLAELKPEEILSAS